MEPGSNNTALPGNRFLDTNHFTLENCSENTAKAVTENCGFAIQAVGTAVGTACGCVCGMIFGSS